MSTKDYNPGMIEAWNKAASEEVVIPFLIEGLTVDEARKKAITQRHRFYRLRAEMVREKHLFAPNATRCKIQLRLTTLKGTYIYPSTRKTWKDEEITDVDLVIVSHDADDIMDKALARAGLHVPEAPEV